MDQLWLGKTTARKLLRLLAATGARSVDRSSWEGPDDRADHAQMILLHRCRLPTSADAPS